MPKGKKPKHSSQSDPEAVQAVLDDMVARNVPRSEIIKYRIEHQDQLYDAERQLMVRFGLNYYDHEITQAHKFGHTQFLINGYTISEWRALTDETYVPSHDELSTLLHKLEDDGKYHEISILYTKYGMDAASHEDALLAQHLLPLETEVLSITDQQIDGLPFNLWKMLNDDSYVPERPILISNLYQLEQSEYKDYVPALRATYRNFISEMEYTPPLNPDEVDQFFNQLFGGESDSSKENQ